MRATLLTLLSLVLFLTASQAQSIRLGHRIPKIKVVSEFGDDLKLIKQPYVCLIFAHSGSWPCINAISQFKSISSNYDERLAIVIITTEKQEEGLEAWERFMDYNTSLAFDIDRRTYDAFGINFVPYCVIYSTKHRRAIWFNSLTQLQPELLERIVYRTKK